MKIRNGFVSNSSSSSFVIPINIITFEQKQKIYNHIEESIKHNEYFDFGSVSYIDSWCISETEYYITGYCIMDNFDMYEFLTKYLNIPTDAIKWGK